MKNTGGIPTAFEWKGIAADGSQVSGVIQASSAARAHNNLLRHHIHILSIKKKRIRRLRQQFTVSQQAVFFNKLSTLLQAGVPLLQTLAMVCTGENNTLPHTVYLTLRDEVMAGNSLAAAFEKFPQYFNRLICHLIRAGEKTGTLDTLLGRIANHLEQMSALRRSLFRVCFYPLVTFVTAISISLFMLMFITPRFAAIFQEMNMPLPTYTRAVVLAGVTLRRLFLPLMALSIATAGIWSFFPGKKTGKGKSHFWRHLPVIGPLFKKNISARFTRTLATLLAAGIPLTEALEMTAPVTGCRYAAMAIQALQQDISKGKQLHQAMLNHPFFSPLMRQMVEAGEESGTLIKMLEKISDLLEAEVAHHASLISRLLEPLIMVILGALIGALIVAMYLPIFKLGNII